MMTARRPAVVSDDDPNAATDGNASTAVRRNNDASIPCVSDEEEEQEAGDDFHSLGSGASTLFFDSDDDYDDDDLNSVVVVNSEEAEDHAAEHVLSLNSSPTSQRQDEATPDAIPSSATPDPIPSVPVVSSSRRVVSPDTVSSSNRGHTNVIFPDNDVPLSTPLAVLSSNRIVSPATIPNTVPEEDDDDNESFWSFGSDGSVLMLDDEEGQDEAWNHVLPQPAVQVKDVMMATLPQPTRANTDTPALSVGARVQLVGGTSPQVGRYGRVEKIGAVRVTVVLDGEQKKRTFGPGNLRVVAGNEESSQSIRMTGVDANEVSSSTKTSLSSYRTALTSPKRVGNAPMEDVTTSPETPSPWLSPDATLLLHSRLGLGVDFVRLLAPGKQSQIQSTFAHCVFGNRLVLYKADVTKDWRNLPREYEEPDGRRYQIIVSKLHRRSSDWGGGKGFPKMELAVAFVLVSGPGLATLDLQRELNSIAGFGRLSPKKAASRLELFLSTACTSNRKSQSHLIFHNVHADDLELVPDSLVGGDMGAGFVPRGFIEKFLGSHAVGKRTNALQVRIFSSKYGIFKGMLMEKVGIDKIQLTPSMQKVGPSEHASSNGSRVSVLITGVFPGKTNYQVAKAFRGDEIGKSIQPPTKISDMALSLLEARGVPYDLLRRYKKKSYDGWKSSLRHAFLVGVPDPTGAIPDGHVFLTGFDDIPDLDETVFFTRFPCTTQNDGLLLPIIKHKPASMNTEEWDTLQRHPVGTIVFSTPSPGQPAIPARIGGDLDGDLYMTLWEPAILSHICSTDTHAVATVNGSLSASDEPRNWNDDWLLEAQQVISSIETLVGHHRLIGSLFAVRKKVMEASGYNSPDAAAWGVAYKDAIDIGKHGGLVRLPRCLWDRLDESLHPFLFDASDDNIRLA